MNIPLRCTLFLLLTILVCTPHPNDIRQKSGTRPVASLLEQAHAMLGEGKYETAVALFEACIADSEFIGQAYAGLALTALAQGRREQAFRHISEGKKLASETPELYLAKITILSQRPSDYDWYTNSADWITEALYDADQALAYGGDRETALYWRANALMQALKFREALALFIEVAMLGGHLSQDALSGATLAEKIVMVDPGTELGMKMALSNQTTRAEMAALLADELEVEGLIDRRDIKLNRRPAMHDVLGHWAETQIRDMVRLGIMEPLQDGNFGSELKVYRRDWIRSCTRIWSMLKDGSSSFDPDTLYKFAEGLEHNPALSGIESLIFLRKFSEAFSP